MMILRITEKDLQFATCRLFTKAKITSCTKLSHTIYVQFSFSKLFFFVVKVKKILYIDVFS